MPFFIFTKQKDGRVTSAILGSVKPSWVPKEQVYLITSEKNNADHVKEVISERLHEHGDTVVFNQANNFGAKLDLLKIKV